MEIPKFCEFDKMVLVPTTGDGAFLCVKCGRVYDTKTRMIFQSALYKES